MMLITKAEIVEIVENSELLHGASNYFDEDYFKDVKKDLIEEIWDYILSKIEV